MRFEIVTDSASNLTDEMLALYDIHMISYIYFKGEEKHLCYRPGRNFVKKAKSYYQELRDGVEIKTSMINTGAIENAVIGLLQAGKDVLFIPISSGISGTFQAARIVQLKLKEQFPDQKFLIVDPRAASFGEGLMVIKAAEMRANGKSIDETAKWIFDNRIRMVQEFIVGDLKFLVKGGRITAAAAFAGNLIQIKPILAGNAEGKIVLKTKVVGEKKALRTMADTCASHLEDPENTTIGIAHCDNPEAAQKLADMIRERTGVKNIILEYYDLCTGAHVGPATVALFYYKDAQV